MPYETHPTATTYTREQLETALDAGQLHATLTNGKVWRVRRNGATRVWKRDPTRFRIPVKAGMYSFGAIQQDNATSDFWIIRP